MTLPGDELVWVPTYAEVKARQKEAAAAAYQQFCHAGAVHKELFRRPLTPRLLKIYNLARVGWGIESIAGRIGVSEANIKDALGKISNNGWKI